MIIVNVMTIRTTHECKTQFTAVCPIHIHRKWIKFEYFCFQKPPEQERKSSLKKKKEDGILAALKIEASKVETS